MHQLTNGLTARGLIQRSQHPEHGRIVQVYVSKTGKQLLEKAHHLISIVEDKMTQNLSLAEKKQVGDVLERCCIALGDVK